METLFLPPPARRHPGSVPVQGHSIVSGSLLSPSVVRPSSHERTVLRHAQDERNFQQLNDPGPRSRRIG